jgi:chromosome segregation ATPase
MSGITWIAATLYFSMSSDDEIVKLTQLLRSFQTACSDLIALNEATEAKLVDLRTAHQQLGDDQHDHLRDCTLRTQENERLVGFLRGELDRRIQEIEDQGSDIQQTIHPSPKLTELESLNEQIRAELVCEKSRNLDLKKRVKVLESQIENSRALMEQRVKEVSEGHKVDIEILLARLDEMEEAVNEGKQTMMKLAKAESEKIELKRSLALSKQECVQLHKDLEGLQIKPSNTAATQREQLHLRRSAELLTVEKSALENRIVFLEERLSSSDAVGDSLRKRLERSESQQRKLESDLNAAATSIDALRREIGRLEGVEKKLRKRSSELIAKFETRLKDFQRRPMCTGENVRDSRPELINNS